MFLRYLSPIFFLALLAKIDAQGCTEGSMMANSEDCDSYLLCVHGEQSLYKCPAGLQFNKKTNFCDWPANVECGGGGEEMTTLPPGPPPAHGPSPRFAPYFDVMIKGPTLSEIFEKTGQKDFTLAFVLGSRNGCDPKWGAEKDLNDTSIINGIRAVQAKGGQMIIALGGAVGPYLEHLCTSVDSLADAYKKILDVVQTNHLDIDIEAPINTGMVNKALAKVQKDRPGTTVSYTLMVQGEDYGVTPELGMKVMQDAAENGVHVDIINPMTMEFGGPSPDYGDQIIGAAKSVIKQMKTVWPKKSDGELRRMLGVTPMLGRNFNTKTFDTKHARKLVDWANNNHIGFLSFWSIGRDNGGCPSGGAPSPFCSGTSQSDYEFTKILQGFKE